MYARAPCSGLSQRLAINISSTDPSMIQNAHSCLRSYFPMDIVGIMSFPVILSGRPSQLTALTVSFVLCIGFVGESSHSLLAMSFDAAAFDIRLSPAPESRRASNWCPKIVTFMYGHSPFCVKATFQGSLQGSQVIGFSVVISTGLSCLSFFAFSWTLLILLADCCISSATDISLLHLVPVILLSLNPHRHTLYDLSWLSAFSCSRFAMSCSISCANLLYRFSSSANSSNRSSLSSGPVSLFGLVSILMMPLVL